MGVSCIFHGCFMIFSWVLNESLKRYSQMSHAYFKGNSKVLNFFSYMFQGGFNDVYGHFNGVPGIF